LTQAVGEKRANALMSEEQTASHTSFADLTALSSEQVAELVMHEQPGVIALVMRFIPGPVAAEVLGILPSEIRRRVIVFMCTASDPSDDVIARVNAILSAKMRSSKKIRKSNQADRLNMIVGILQHADRPIEEDLLAAVQEKSEALAKDIRDRLFTFEDVVKLSDIAIRRVMQEIDMAVLAIALRNANVELREKFFRNMSKRAAQGLKGEMEFAQKVRLTDVQAKQREIVNVVRNLEAEGQLTTGTTDEYV
jgi:flagellar motor switch protein FliG